jgi:hypothetical protein
MTIRKEISSYGLMKSIDDTTSTGAGTSFPVANAQTVALQVNAASTAAVATQVKVQGSLDGTNWVDIIAAQSYTSTGAVIKTSTGVFMVNHVRAVTTVHTATGAITAYLAAR